VVNHAFTTLRDLAATSGANLPCGGFSAFAGSRKPSRSDVTNSSAEVARDGSVRVFDHPYWAGAAALDF
jgi:hypothetical protein